MRIPGFGAHRPFLSGSKRTDPTQISPRMQAAAANCTGPDLETRIAGDLDWARTGDGSENERRAWTNAAQRPKRAGASARIAIGASDDGGCMAPRCRVGPATRNYQSGCRSAPSSLGMSGFHLVSDCSAVGFRRCPVCCIGITD
jgi:hypothetical protein